MIRGPRAADALPSSIVSVRDPEGGVVFGGGVGQPGALLDSRLFDGDGFGEIARLIYVISLKIRHIIGEQLQRNNGGHRLHDFWHSR